MLAHRARVPILLTLLCAAASIALRTPREPLHFEPPPRAEPPTSIWSIDGMKEIQILTAIARAQPRCHPVSTPYDSEVQLTVRDGEARFSLMHGERHWCAESCRADALDKLHLPTRLLEGTTVTLTIP